MLCPFSVIFNIAIKGFKREVWLATKPGSTNHFFLKMSCTIVIKGTSSISQEYGSFYLIVRFCVCYIVDWFFLLHVNVYVDSLYSSYR